MNVCDPSFYRFSTTIQGNELRGIPKSSNCLIQVWAAGGGGGGSPAGDAITPGFPNSRENATGGGGGGGGSYAAILIKNKNLLNGSATIGTVIGEGGRGQLSGAPNYDGGDGGDTQIYISSSGLFAYF